MLNHALPKEHPLTNTKITAKAVALITALLIVLGFASAPAA